MKKFLDKLHSRPPHHQQQHQPPSASPNLSSLPPQQQPQPPPQITPPSTLDILQYRLHHGPNLGSLFVLEKWLSPSMFPSTSSGDSELDALTCFLSTSSPEQTKARWAAHRSSFTPSQEDISWLVHTASATAVRLPIGYFTLGPDFCVGTPFEQAARLSGVYGSAWEEVKSLVKRLRRDGGIGVLLDLHALPGGANRDAHSGTSSGRAAFWDDGPEGQRNRELGRRCVEFIVREIVRDGELREGVTGVQLCNEATWEAGQKRGGKKRGVMYEWYEDVLSTIQEIDDRLPVFVSDAWDLEEALKWAVDVSSVEGEDVEGEDDAKGGRGADPKRRRPRFNNPLIIDTHKYYTFSSADRSSSPSDILARIPSALSVLSPPLIGSITSPPSGGAAQVIIGEYSCVLDTATWSRVSPAEKEGHVKKFGELQTKTWFGTPGCGGSCFWTWKMEWLPGGEWGFVEQISKGHILPPLCLTLSREQVRSRIKTAMEKRQQLGERAKREHEEYWKRVAPEGEFEHWRYNEGWEVGFSDALCFFEGRGEGRFGEESQKAGGGDRIGCLEVWTRKRLIGAGQLDRNFGWEWEHGFRAGVKGFEDVVGI